MKQKKEESQKTITQNNYKIQVVYLVSDNPKNYLCIYHKLLSADLCILTLLSCIILNYASFFMSVQYCCVVF